MADVFSKVKRSEVMSRIRGHGNKDTELALMRLFRSHGITGWRRKYIVFGKPDFVFPKLRVAVFVDGCFWHACPICQPSLPSSNSDFWKEKFAKNRARDIKKNRELTTIGWTSLTIWECELKNSFRSAIKRITEALRSSSQNRTRI